MKFADQEITRDTVPFYYSYFSTGGGWDDFLAVDLLYKDGRRIRVSSEVHHMEACNPEAVIQDGESLGLAIKKYGSPDYLKLQRFDNTRENPENWIKESLVLSYSEFLKAID